METFTWWQYYWQALIKTLEFPDNLLGIIAIIFLIIKVFPSKYERMWRNSKMNRGYQWIKKYSLKVFVALVVVTLIYAPYGMYQENQAEANKILGEYQAEIITLKEQNKQMQELFRPELLLEISNVRWGTDNNTGLITIKFQSSISNIGEKTAYQTQVKRVLADLRTPSDTFIPKDWIEYNPIYKNEKIVTRSETTWSKKWEGEEILTLLIYAKLKYSDAPSGGYWHEQPLWLAIIVDTVNENITCKGAEQEWIDLLKPYIKNS